MALTLPVPALGELDPRLTQAMLAPVARLQAFAARVATPAPAPPLPLLSHLPVLAGALPPPAAPDGASSPGAGSPLLPRLPPGLLLAQEFAGALLARLLPAPAGDRTGVLGLPAGTAPPLASLLPGIPGMAPPATLPSPVAAPPFVPLPGLASGPLPPVGLPAMGFPLPVTLPPPPVPLGALPGLPGPLLERVSGFLEALPAGPGSSLPGLGALPGTAGSPAGAAGGPGAGPPDQRTLLLSVLRPIALAVAGEPPLLLDMLQSRAGAQLAARMLTDFGATVPGLLPAVRTAALRALAGGSSRDRAASARLGQVLGALSSLSPRFLDLLEAPETLAAGGGTALLAGLERAVARRPERARILGEHFARERPELAPLLARGLAARGTEPTPLWGAVAAGLAHSPRFALRFVAGLAGRNPSEAQALSRLARAAPGRATALAFALGQALASTEEVARPVAATLGSFIGTRTDLAGAALSGATREIRRRGVAPPAGGLLWSLPVLPLARAAERSLALREALDAQLLKLAREPRLLERWVRQRPEALPTALERLPSLALPLIQSAQGRRVLQAAPRAVGALARALPRVAATPLARALAAPGNTRVQLPLARAAGALAEVAGGAVTGDILGLIRRPSLAREIAREVERGVRGATGRWPALLSGGTGRMPAPAQGPRGQRGLLPPGVSGSRPGAPPPPPPVPALLRAPHRPPKRPALTPPLSLPGSPRGRQPGPAAHLPGSGSPGPAVLVSPKPRPTIGSGRALHTAIRTPHRPRALSPPSSPAPPPGAGFRSSTPAAPGSSGGLPHSGSSLASGPAAPGATPRAAPAMDRPAAQPRPPLPQAPPLAAALEGARGAAALRQSLVEHEGAGQRIPREHRGPMERFFGRPMEDVRLHTGPGVAQAASMLRADAFTIGRDVFFGRGRLALGNQAGQALLAHELTHVVQQSTLGRRLHGYGNAPQTLEEEARKVEQIFRTWDVGTESAALRVGRYQRTYVNMGQAPLTPDVEGRLERISLLALEVCGRLLEADGLFHGDRHTISRLEVDLDLDLARVSDAEAAEAWGHALARAIREKVEAASPALRAAVPRDDALRIQREGFGDLRIAEGRMAAEEKREARERLRNDPGGPTITLPGPGGKDWLFSTNPKFVHRQVYKLVAEAGWGGLRFARSHLSLRHEMHTSEWRRYERGELQLKPHEVARLRQELEIEKYLVRRLEEYDRKMEALHKEFLPGFGERAKKKTEDLLDASERIIRSEMQRYGLLLRDDVGYYALQDRAGPHAFNMAAAAGELSKLHKEVEALKREQRAKYTRAHTVETSRGGWRKLSTYDIIDRPGYDAKEAEIKKKQTELDLARHKYETLYPILSSFTSRDRWDELAKIGNSTDIAPVIGEDIAEKLRNIRTVRAEMKPGGKFNVWKFPEMIELTLVEERRKGQPEYGLAKERVEVVAQRDTFDSLAWGILAIGLGLLTGGGGLLALGATVGGAAISVREAFKHLQEYQLQKAASGTAFDKAKAISSQEPSLFWLALDLIGAGLDLGAAARAFRTLSEVHTLAKVEQAVPEGKALDAAKKQLQELEVRDPKATGGKRNLSAGEADKLVSTVVADGAKKAPDVPKAPEPLDVKSGTKTDAPSKPLKPAEQEELRATPQSDKTSGRRGAKGDPKDKTSGRRGGKGGSKPRQQAEQEELPKTEEVGLRDWLKGRRGGKGGSKDKGRTKGERQDAPEDSKGTGDKPEATAPAKPAPVASKEPRAILPNGKELAPDSYSGGYHATTAERSVSPEVVMKTGLPARGNDWRLQEHTEELSHSAFRGTTKMPGEAVNWYGEGGYVYEIRGVPTWDVNKALEGQVKVAGMPGHHRGNLMHGEGEYAIPAHVPPEKIKRWGVVKKNSAGKLYVDWQQ
jgi:uncharacterized protein DUF4157